MNTNYVNQNVNKNVNKPWVEKYRPSTFNDIILDDINKTIFSNMIKKIIFQIYFFMYHLVQEKQPPL